MSSNNTGKNIANAGKVIFETCENVEKLLAFLNEQAREKSGYIPCTPKPLRLRGNSEFNDEALLVFQRKQDKKSVYIIDISLWDNDVEDDEAKAYISKFEYANPVSFNNKPISRGDFYQFSAPISKVDEITDLKFDAEHYEGLVRDKDQADEDYRGLRRVIGFAIPLTSITADEAHKMIFGGFDMLVDK